MLISGVHFPSLSFLGNVNGSSVASRIAQLGVQESVVFTVKGAV